MSSMLLLLVLDQWMAMLISSLYKMEMVFCGMMLIPNLGSCPEKMGWVERASLWGESLVQHPLIDHHVIWMTTGGFSEASPLLDFDLSRIWKLMPEGETFLLLVPLAGIARSRVDR